MKLLSRLRRAGRADRDTEPGQAPFPAEFVRILDALHVSLREPTTDPDLTEAKPRVVVHGGPLGLFMYSDRTNLVRRIERALPGHSPRSVARLADGVEQAIALAVRADSFPSERANGLPVRRPRRRWLTAHLDDAEPAAPVTTWSL